MPSGVTVVPWGRLMLHYCQERELALPLPVVIMPFGVTVVSGQADALLSGSVSCALPLPVVIIAVPADIRAMEQ